MTANAILMALRPEGKVMVVFSVCEGRNGVRFEPEGRDIEDQFQRGACASRAGSMSWALRGAILLTGSAFGGTPRLVCAGGLLSVDHKAITLRARARDYAAIRSEDINHPT